MTSRSGAFCFKGINDLFIMTLDLTQNYFALFQQVHQYDIDDASLANRFRELQSQWHPDRFALASDEERRISIQNTAFINEAYETLKTPRLRARYLLELANISFNDEIETSKDPMFLMQQMELRENIEEVAEADDPFERLDELSAEVRQQAKDLEMAFKTHYDAADYESAKAIVLKMRFFERIRGELRTLEEKLDDTL